MTSNILGGSLTPEERKETWDILLMLKQAMEYDKSNKKLQLKHCWNWNDWIKNYTR